MEENLEIEWPDANRYRPARKQLKQRCWCMRRAVKRRQGRRGGCQQNFGSFSYLVGTWRSLREWGIGNVTIQDSVLALVT